MTDTKKTYHSFGINQLLSASTSGMLLFKQQDDGEYVCTVDNDSACQLTGSDSLNGTKWQGLVDQIANKSSVAKASAENPIPELNFEAYFAVTDAWCRLSNTPVNEHNFLCTITDITHYKEIEAREDIVLDILRDAERTVQFGTWVWYPESQVVEWSEGLYVMLGYSPNQASQNPAEYGRFMKHVHPDDLERVVNDNPVSIGAKEPVETEYRIKTLSGEVKSVLSRSIYHSGNATHPAKLTGCIVDLTSIKQVRNELVRKVEELNRSNSDLEQFAYVASHDLQEPLRKIVSFGERLEKKSKDMLDEETGMYLDRILNATRRMQNMISNLLEFSRLTRTQQGFVPTDLNQIAKNVLGDLELVSKQKNAVIDIGEMFTIEAIPSQMTQLFQNLLSNSLKFTDEGVQPEIRVTAESLGTEEQINYGLPSQGSYVRLTFSDNGIGFDDQDSARIFTLFQRLRGRSEYEGTGIGLSVCKKVVENHSGLILASGETGQGATFTVLLPLSQSGLI
ncbi:ATP-binding protein [Persicitalea sp.]|uniref:sensor histidine kinase n=1 Tax=Persicitalea sp. TaxID=3100273 RepID=UPI003592FA1F